MEGKNSTKWLKQAVEVAGGKKPADLVLKNARYLDVFCGKVRTGDIAVWQGKIVGVGSYSGKEEADASDWGIAVPGLIDSHIHIESTQLVPEEFARLAVPCGTTLIIADPHEIVNVCGLEGAEYMLGAAARTPLDVRLMLPSCVPATPFETSGASVTAKDAQNALKGGKFWGLGEMMNYVGVIAGDEEALGKIAAANALGKVVDGHAPRLTGEQLKAYLVAGARTDHECATAEEALEKVSKGMYVLLREGSASHDMANLAPAVNEYNFRRFALCTDDRHADDLIREGHINNALRRAVECGIKPEAAVIMCTLNAAECYNLEGKGAIAVGYDADIAFFKDFKKFECACVYKGGKQVAKDGKALFSVQKSLSECVKNTVHTGKVCADSFKMSVKGGKARAITVSGGTLVTGSCTVDVDDCGDDIALKDGVNKIAVVERHFASGNIGLGLLKDYGIKGGAVATSVSHDSHNIIVAGDSNAAMAAAVEELARIGGGMSLVCKEGVYSVPLDVAGLMSSQPAEKHAAMLAELCEKAYSLGVNREIEAFMTLSFIALAVLPELRLTDKGLFDSVAFKFVDLQAK